jgi:glycosyltransferase involved in cell wall biosynthesis
MSDTMTPGLAAVPSTSHPPDLTGLRVLHVVQKFSSGVGSAIAQYTRSLPEVEHHLLSGTPVDAEGDLAEQADFRSAHLMTGTSRAKLRRVREVVREVRPDVVHAHSSHGGVYARLGVARTAHPLVYTPHCYSFERRDVPAATRGAFWLAEALLAINTTAFAACAPREWQLSRWPTRRAPRYLVPNIAPTSVPERAGRGSGPPLVTGGGRLSVQKDPAFFLELVRRLRVQLPDLRAAWLGDGDPEQREALTAAGVEVTGWLPRGEALELLSAADLYVHSARWEGFPLMVAEAVAARVPTLVRRLPSFADVPADLTMGGADDVSAALGCLSDPAVARSNVSAWSAVLSRNTAASQRAALIDLYSGARPAPLPGG